MAELDLLGSILSSMERPPAAADGETRRRARGQRGRGGRGGSGGGGSDRVGSGERTAGKERRVPAFRPHNCAPPPLSALPQARLRPLARAPLIDSGEGKRALR